MRLARCLPFIFSAIVILSVASLAYAESIVWNKTIPEELRGYFSGLRYPDGRVPGLAGHGGWIHLRNANATIQYNTRAVKVSSGEVLSPGARVSVGESIRFEFMPHVYTDISWFGTGGPNDSPYGDWKEGAQPPPIECLQKDYIGETFDGVGPQKQFVALSVEPPHKSLVMPSAMTCNAPDADGTRVCSFAQEGDYTPEFNFASTFGKFYLRLTSPRFMTGCAGNNAPMGTGSSASAVISNPYTLPVDAQAIAFPLTVISSSPANSDTHTPTTPSLTAGACTVGSPHTISMTTTDPDNNQLRYGIDWDADGFIDQFVPPSGYVTSGTAETASRTYSMAGPKTVKVLAQDMNGLTSSWASVSFNCASASSGDDSAGVSGMSGTGGATGGPSQPPAIDISLRVIPSLVKRGETTRVHWSTANLVSCTVTATNGDTWNGLLSTVGGEVSQPITKLVIYTLTCRDADGVIHTKRALAGVVPNWREK